MFEQQFLHWDLRELRELDRGVIHAGGRPFANLGTLRENQGAISDLDLENL